MRHNKFISVDVPNHLVDRARDYGEAAVKTYASGGSERSRNVGLKLHPIDKDPTAQMMGRVCEIAAALALGLDPDDDLQWENHADPGWDLIFNGLRIDVKGTWHPKGKLLLWPASKTHIYPEASFNALMMVWAASKDSGCLGRCEARGWILKDVFNEKHFEAEANNRLRLEVGTWGLHQDHLSPISELLETQKLPEWVLQEDRW